MRDFVISERGEMEMEEAGAQSGGEQGATQMEAVGGEPGTPQRVAEVDESVQEGEGGGWQEVTRGASGERRWQGKGGGGAERTFPMGQ